MISNVSHHIKNAHASLRFIHHSLFQVLESKHSLMACSKPPFIICKLILLSRYMHEVHRYRQLPNQLAHFLNNIVECWLLGCVYLIYKPNN